MDGEISENKAGFIDIIKDYTVVFSKSQLPEIRIKRAAAMTEIRRKYNELCGVDLNERRLAKKLINMKSRLKIKIDMLRKENKPILLKDYERKLLDLMQGEKHKSRIGMEEAAVALFGGQTTSAAIDSPEVADTAQEASVFLPGEEIIPGPSTPGSLEERQNEFKFDNYETEVTWNLSINELKRYVLLKQLRVLEMKEQQILKKNRVLDLEEEKLLWEKEKRLHQVEQVKAEPVFMPID